MHIPDAMLQGKICPVTAVVSAVGLAAAAYFGTRSEKPAASRFAAVTALIFAAQMMNFPVMNGTSGHLLGGVLAAALLGTPFGVLSIALVVTIQSLVFADGGVTVLGANLLNMALIGAAGGGLLRAWLLRRMEGIKGNIIATFIAAWASIAVAALAVSVELALDGKIAFSKVVTAMVGTHLLIGFGEAAITVAVCALLGASVVCNSRSGNVAAPLGAAVIIALALSPFASGFPDGLEWVAEKYQFFHESAPVFAGPLPDYAATFVSNGMLQTGLAGLIGVAISFAAGWSLLRVLSFSARAALPPDCLLPSGAAAEAEC